MLPVGVTEAKRRDLTARMTRLGLREEDLVEKFVRSAGHGGQKVNKASSCVYLCHPPSGIEVKCQQERSQALNRFLARRLLCERLEELAAGRRSARQQAAEKIRRQKRRRSRRQRDRMLADKRHVGAKKDARRAPGSLD